MSSSEPLHVVALISGGKDSFFSIVHCLDRGHRVVALANLYPPSESEPESSEPPLLPSPSPSSNVYAAPYQVQPVRAIKLPPPPDGQPGRDLDSYMYQTVGHQVVPLYAAALHLPLYRKPITGRPIRLEKDYDPASVLADQGEGDRGEQGEGGGRPEGGEKGGGGEKGEDEDETESMLDLIRTVKSRHPEANALCSGAILSTYQRTRVESVAVRLGLVPLAFLWKYPTLPPPRPTGPSPARAGPDPAEREAQLLLDMAEAGLDGRIIKTASSGLDAAFLWERATSEAGAARLVEPLRPFGGEGAILGEGGEFETLVVDGPPALFKSRIVVPAEARSVVAAGNGCFWLNITDAHLVDNPPRDPALCPATGDHQPHQPDQPPGLGHARLVDENMPEAGGASARGSQQLNVRRPDLLDQRFCQVSRCLSGPAGSDEISATHDPPAGGPAVTCPAAAYRPHPHIERWCVALDRRDGQDGDMPIRTEIALLTGFIRDRLEKSGSVSSSITSATILLRRMSDFAAVNAEYGKLFTTPNPPSRVTVSCGSMLPARSGVVIYLELQKTRDPSARRGLHVQSRSYWAPANIGPYSQAIDLPLFSGGRDGGGGGDDDDDDDDDRVIISGPRGPLAITIAGQIPLVPATMTMPERGDDDDGALEFALGLQHLWRIGADMGVQIWTSAVAYLPRSTGSSAGARAAFAHAVRRAAAAWHHAHAWEEPLGGEGLSEDDRQDETDIWHRLLNPQFNEFADAEPKDQPRLPDWSVFSGPAHPPRRAAAGRRPIPPLVIAEVDELPRQASVEWHAHLGLAGIDEGAVQAASCTSPAAGPSFAELARWESFHLFVRSGKKIFTHGLVWFESLDPQRSGRSVVDGVVKACSEGYGAGLVQACGGALRGAERLQPHLVYVDAGLLGEPGWTPPAPPESGSPSSQVMVIPCGSLWMPDGKVVPAGEGPGLTADPKRLVAVGVFRAEYRIE